MKTLMALAGALGLSVSAAAAACPGHVSASVDKELVVASIAAPADTKTVKADKEEE